MKPVKIIIRALIAAVGAGCMALAYFSGRIQSTGTAQNLLDELDSLRKGEADAAVVKRVSQQMEEIAYQQKEISDKQRDRAEQQSALAMQMRDRAEQESRSARLAEQKAVAAAQETERQRANALEQQRIALEQRDQATYAKRVSDTLNYRTLARSLATSSIHASQNKHQELASLLAYASYYFLHSYKGDTYQSELFQALDRCTNTYKTVNMPHRGSVTALCATTSGWVAVSDYGEIISYDAQKDAVTSLLEQPLYNFRDVLQIGSVLYALDYNGQLYIHRPGTKGQALLLPGNRYIRLLHPVKNQLLLVAKKSVCRYDLETGQLSKSLSVDKEITAIYRKGDGYGLFFADKSYEEMDVHGRFTHKGSPVGNQVVTSACSTDGRLLVGAKNGTIDVVEGSKVTTSNVHRGEITDMVVSGSVMVTTSFDKTVQVWSLPDLCRSQIYTPVEYTYSAWPVSLCRLPSGDVLIGFSNGMIQRMDVSVDHMAATLLRHLKRNFTPQEWDSYVGTGVPYVRFASLTVSDK